MFSPPARLTSPSGWRIGLTLSGLAGLVGLVGTTAWLPALGAEPETSPPISNPATAEVIEATRSTVRESAVWVAQGVDSWFGDRPFKTEGAVRDGQLSLGLRQRQDRGFNVDLRFNARFRLPNLEALGYLFVGRDNPREIISDVPGAFSSGERLTPRPTEDLSFFAGFGREISDAVDFRLGFRGGLKPYAQARYRRPWQFGEDDKIEFRQTLFWSADDRLGTTTAVSAEHAWSPDRLARWLSAATITQDEPDLGWQTRGSLHQSFGPQRWLSAELLLSGRRHTGVDVDDYGVQLRWEQPLHRDWLLGELLVGHFWPRPDVAEPRGRAWALGVRLKLGF